MSQDTDKRKENPRDPQVLAGKWTKEIAASKKWLQKYHSAGHIIEREYISQNSATSPTLENTSRYNIFWANVQVQLAAVYTKMPVPEVDRTHFDQNDDVARVAALILERIFSLELKNLDESPFDLYQLAIQDRFVAGMGVVWPRYTYKEEKLQRPAILHAETGAELAPAYEETIITDEAVPLDYVRWDDFFYSPCRVWSERRWVARRVFMSKSKCTARFGDVITGQLQFKNNTASKHDNDPYRLSPEHNAEVFEIWDKDTLCTSWFSVGCPVILDYKDDPLKLSGFFPVKKPLMATHITTAFIPRPDYAMVQDQYAELNLIATRTTLLTQALKLIGVYDKNSEALQRLVSQASINQMIPVDNWAMFAEKGGIKGQVDWMPLEMVANTLEQLTRRKGALLQEIYEILGLSDIMRGQSVASETATAQQLKAQYGSARMQNVQNSIAEFITDATRTRGEIICLHWKPETIIERSQIMATPDKALVPQAVQLLKSNTQMALRLTVHADTIAAPDWNQEKQLRVDFLQAVSQFITMSMPLIEHTPGAAPFLIQIMQWAAAGFKGGKQIEGVLDQALMSMQQQPAGQPPSAKEAEATAKASKMEMDAVQKQMGAEQAAAKASQDAAKREMALQNQIAQDKVDSSIKEALLETRNLIVQHECKMQLLFANAENEELAKEAKIGVDSAETKASEVGEMKDVNAELVKGIDEILKNLAILTQSKRSIRVTLPDGGEAVAEVSHNKE